MEVKPEAWNGNEGVFTVTIHELPAGYGAGAIAWAECDGVRTMETKAADGKYILVFRRDEITVLPLDLEFVLVGRFTDGVWFEGTDEVSQVISVPVG